MFSLYPFVTKFFVSRPVELQFQQRLLLFMKSIPLALNYFMQQQNKQFFSANFFPFFFIKKKEEQ